MNSFKQNIYKSSVEEVAPPSVQDILLGYSDVDSTTSCTNIAIPVTRYIPSGQDWSVVTYLYADAGGTTPAISGWYSDGAKWYYWNGTSETFTSTGFC